MTVDSSHGNPVQRRSTYRRRTDNDRVTRRPALAGKPRTNPSAVRPAPGRDRRPRLRIPADVRPASDTALDALDEFRCERVRAAIVESLLEIEDAGTRGGLTSDDMGDCYAAPWGMCVRDTVAVLTGLGRRPPIDVDRWIVHIGRLITGMNHLVGLSARAAAYGRLISHGSTATRVAPQWSMPWTLFGTASMTGSTEPRRRSSPRSSGYTSRRSRRRSPDFGSTLGSSWTWTTRG